MKWSLSLVSLTTLVTGEPKTLQLSEAFYDSFSSPMDQRWNRGDGILGPYPATGTYPAGSIFYSKPRDLLYNTALTPSNTTLGLRITMQECTDVCCEDKGINNTICAAV